MAKRLENSTTKKKPMKVCAHGCAGELRGDNVTRVFQRRGSLVEVIVENIPASVCTLCGNAFFGEAIAHEIDGLLAPFHGRRNNIPKLPPARVIVNFAEAQGSRDGARGQ